MFQARHFLENGILPESSDQIMQEINYSIKFHRLELDYDGECHIQDSQTYLMEIKVPAAYPVWLADILCELQIYPVSFSKYGSVYSDSVKNGELHPWIEA